MLRVAVVDRARPGVRGGGPDAVRRGGAGRRPRRAADAVRPGAVRRRSRPSAHPVDRRGPGAVLGTGVRFLGNVQVGADLTRRRAARALRRGPRRDRRRRRPPAGDAGGGPPRQHVGDRPGRLVRRPPRHSARRVPARTPGSRRGRGRATSPATWPGCSPAPRTSAATDVPDHVLAAFAASQVEEVHLWPGAGRPRRGSPPASYVSSVSWRTPTCGRPGGPGADDVAAATCRCPPRPGATSTSSSAGPARLRRRGRGGCTCTSSAVRWR